MLTSLILGGCSYHPEVGGVADDAAGDSAVTDTSQPPDANVCAGTLLSVCFDPASPPTLSIDAGILDTDTDPRCVASLTEACAITAGAITVTAGSVSVRGSRPLVLVAATTLTVDGTLDASSTRSPAVIGAAANWSSCAAGNTPQNGNGSNSSGGGGAGGSFTDRGGDGGDGSTNRTSKNGGTSGATVDATMLHGGCRGQNGGTSGSAGGPGGSSGGALYLISAQTISVSSTGRVFASGAGGAGGESQQNGGGGGGGGGSGGMIAFEAPTITITGIVAANGGGGGGGAGGSSSNVDGGPGGDGTTTSFSTRATGGAAGDAGATDGGRGGIANPLAGEAAGNATQAGGGGGAGSAGLIWAKGALTGAQISPAPTLQ